MTRLEEFTHLNRLALRLIRFKLNHYVKHKIMNKQERIAQQVWGDEGIGKYTKLREITQKEGVTIGEARRILKARQRAQRKAERLSKKFKAKGWKVKK